MTASLTVAYDELTVAVRCADAAHLRWLQEMLTPWFTVTHGTADCTVELVVDRDAYRRIVGARPHEERRRVAFVFDRGPVELPVWSTTASEIILFDARDEILYGISHDRRRVRLLTSTPSLSRRVRLMRVVRELAMARAWTARCFVLHAAAFAQGGGAVLVAGAKGVGKTTLLWHGLDGAGTALVANDRVVVDLGCSPPSARGMPSVVSVREPMLRLFPALAERWAATGYTARRNVDETGRNHRPTLDRGGHLTPAQLCALRGVSRRRELPVALLLLPRRGGAAPIALDELPPAVAAPRIAAAVFAAHSPRKASEVFAPAGGDGTAATLETLARELAERVPCLDCVLGDWTAAPPPPLAHLLQPYLG
jgi:hypothetical protein